MRKLKNYSVLCCTEIRRNFSYSIQKNLRVRFAPSPTGFLHLGGLRTALYNYLFAKSRNGAFILRIEDTDQKRLIDDAIKKLEFDLKWAGIEVNEGPSAGGSYGPYLQSQRLELYRNEVNTLLENGSAYYCFCTETRLDLLRRDAMKRREVPKYDNKCRHSSSKTVREKLDLKLEHCIRFKLTDYSEPFDDLIYGPIICNVANIEGDPVIIKKDGYPTYHFANVVDDHHMQISHVLRGHEWQTSTTKHLLLYKAFNWKPPVFAHLPLLLNEDGTKLSKRQQNITVENYRNDGIFPLALINFVVSCGSYSKKQIISLQSMEELIQSFRLDLVTPNSCHVNYDLLPQFNRLVLKRNIEIASILNDMVHRVKCLIQDTYSNRENTILNTDDEYIRKVIVWSVDRIQKLNDLVSPQFSFLWCQPDVYDVSPNNILFYNSLHAFTSKLETHEFLPENIVPFVKEFCMHNNLEYGPFMRFLRNVISGLKNGPGISEMMLILGKQDTLSRLRKAVQSCANKKINAIT